MICPLLAIATQGDLKEAHRSLVMCAKEECAWWSKSMEACCIPVLAANFIGLNETLLHIQDQMPHEG